MNTELRRSKRYADFLPISVTAMSGISNSIIAGPFSGRIIDISKNGACLLMTQVLMKTYHIYHSTRENDSSFLQLHINLPPDLNDFVIPARPVWISPFDIEEIKAFKMGVDFMINPDGEQMGRLEKVMMQKQKERDELWSAMVSPIKK
ncbi:MAG: PilZ domain-containing protein [Desulfobulbaceae bacterium]|nr:PilZ domain-containing protein [Desulfobulbaceae bacterium]